MNQVDRLEQLYYENRRRMYIKILNETVLVNGQLVEVDISSPDASEIVEIISGYHFRRTLAKGSGSLQLTLVIDYDIGSKHKSLPLYLSSGAVIETDRGNFRIPDMDKLIEELLAQAHED